MTTSAPPREPDQAHIVLVDDTRLMRTLYGRILEAEGYRVTAVGGGAAALRVLEHATPELVLLDHMMPDMSGADVLARMRKDPRLAAIPTVFLTASALDVSQAFELGATDYFTKPIDRRSLVARVRALITSNRLARAARAGGVNARDCERIVADLKEAQAVQRSQVPGGAVRWGAWATAGAILPCHSVGGDLFDVVCSEASCTVMVVDVSGHGLAAAMVASGIRAMLRLLVKDGPIENTLDELNRLLGDAPDDHYACVALVEIGAERVRVINAGLPPIIALRGDATLWQCAASGLPPGLFPRGGYEVFEAPVAPGMSIVIATDGITELGDVALAREFAKIGADEARLRDRVGGLSPGRDAQLDDETVVVAVHRTSGDPPGA